MLYQLSYASSIRPVGMERETGIEPATNSLEGCDSTIELLPPGGRIRNSSFEPIVLQMPTIAALTGRDPTGINMNSAPFFQRRCSFTVRVTFGIRITAMSPEDSFKTNAY